MSKASKIHNSLSKDQHQFYKEKTLSSTRKLKDWVNFLSKISILDKLGDKKVKTYMTIAVVSFIAAFLSAFIAIAIESETLGIVIILLITTGIVSLSIRKKHKQNDINDYLRLFFLPILQVLKDKAGEDTKMSANLDFRNARKSQEPIKSDVRGRKQNFFTQTYIISKLTLTDGSLLEFVIKDDIKDLTWTKRGASGKTKYKSKTKIVHHCLIKMTLPKGEYTWNGSENPDIQIVDHNDQYIAKVKVKIKKVGDEVLHVKAFFDTIQSIYKQFEPINPTSNARTSQDDSVPYEDSFIAVPYVWYGGYFDRYDYDSFDYNDNSEIMSDDDTATVFDS